MKYFFYDDPKLIVFDESPYSNPMAPSKAWNDETGQWVAWDLIMAGSVKGGNWDPITAEQAAEITGERAETP